MNQGVVGSVLMKKTETKFLVSVSLECSNYTYIKSQKFNFSFLFRSVFRPICKGLVFFRVKSYLMVVLMFSANKFISVSVPRS
jgi:hypothetical protein